MMPILPGNYIQEVFIPLDVRRGKPNEPFAIKLCISWSILGGPPDVQTSSRVQVNLTSGEEYCFLKQPAQGILEN